MSAPEAFGVFLAIVLMGFLAQWVATLLIFSRMSPSEGENYHLLLKKSRTWTESHVQELEIFRNALLFSKVRVRDCMIPRTEVEAIDFNAPVEELHHKFIATGYSKLIVYKEDIDHIAGYVSSKELFKKPIAIADKLTSVPFVPETMPANIMLREFLKLHKSIAVVVDEYGGTSGIVTIEDIMEEIFGEIEDEHDSNDFIERKVNENEYVFSGRLEISYLNTKYGLHLPENEDYQTLAGLILYYSHNLPKNQEVVNFSSYIFKILKSTPNRIELILLKRKAV
jgi:CBS domain containing-hemolysin-like protein